MKNLMIATVLLTAMSTNANAYDYRIPEEAIPYLQGAQVSVPTTMTPDEHENLYSSGVAQAGAMTFALPTNLKDGDTAIGAGVGAFNSNVGVAVTIGHRVGSVSLQGGISAGDGRVNSLLLGAGANWIF